MWKKSNLTLDIFTESQDHVSNYYLSIIDRSAMTMPILNALVIDLNVVESMKYILGSKCCISHLLFLSKNFDTS
jgi:hypothetical protein